MTLDARQISAFDQTTEVTFNGLVEAVAPSDAETTAPTDESKTTTETRAQEAKKEGGCMKIFATILQVVAAVVAVVGGPKGMAIAAALNAAAKSMMPAESSTSGGEPVDVAQINREFDSRRQAALVGLRPMFADEPQSA